MKERMIGTTAPEARVSQPALTKPASSTYPRRGEQNMPDGGRGEIPMNKVDTAPAPRQETTVNRASVPSSTASQETKSSQQNEGPRKPISAERVAQARAAWEEANKGKTLSVEERRTQEMMIERGYPPMPGAADRIGDVYGDPILQGIADDLNDEVDRVNPGGENRPLSERFIQRNIERVQQLADSGAVNRNQARQLLRTLNEWSGEAEAVREAARMGGRRSRFDALPDEIKDAVEGRLWNKLGVADFIQLYGGDRDIINWVNKQIDTLYVAAGGKDPAQSSAYEGVSRAYQEAVTFLESTHPENISILSELFETRLRLMNMNAAVSTKSLESIKKAAFGLTAHGLLEGLRLDDRRVNAIFNRMSELLEDTRLKAIRGHLAPEMLPRLQENLINEQIELAIRGAGDFAGAYTDALARGGDVDEARATVRVDISRAVRTARDIIIVSQREAVIASRGRHLFGIDAFFSDVGAAFKNMNIEAFVSSKWGVLNLEDQEVNRLIKDSLAEDWLSEKRKQYPNDNITLTKEQKDELGDRQLQELSTIPDFFTSGWRIDGIFDQMIDYFEHTTAIANGVTVDRLTDVQKMAARTKATEFGLFMQLKTGADYTKRERDAGQVREDVWGKVTQYRPEEIMRLLRERLSEGELTAINNVIFQAYGVAGYDEFKEKFGAAIRVVREQGFRADDPSQTNFADLTDAQTEELNRATGGQAHIVKQVYQSMQGYITGNNITSVLFDRDPRFSDIYARTITPDDALLDRLEDVYLEEGYKDMVALTKRWSSDLGGDALVRNMTDLEEGNAAMDEYIAFIKAMKPEDRMKHAEESAKHFANVNGRSAEAKVIRHTVITVMQAAAIPMLYDALGIAKLPGRMPMTKMERIRGPHETPMSQDERLKMFDELRGVLYASVQNRLDEIDSDSTLSAEKKEEEKRKAHEGAEKFLKLSAIALRITGKDRFAQGLLRMLIYSLILSLVEANNIVDLGSVVSQKRAA